MALALFDLDNTLVDRTAAFAAALPRLAEQLGLDPAEAVPFMIAADDDGAVGWETWMAATVAAFALDITVTAMQAAFRPLYLGCYRLDPAVAEGLSALRAAGWRLGIVTNGPPSQTEKILGTGLDRLVDGWAVSGEVGARKPDRRIFEHAAAVCRSPLDHGWMVGDSVEADVAGAHGAGLRSIWIDRGRAWPGAGGTGDAGPAVPPPDHQVARVADVFALIGEPP